MDWFGATADEVDRGFDRFGGLSAAATAELCSVIQAADLGQLWMADGARSLTEWVALRLRLRLPNARQLVGVARRLVDLPVLSARFACGDLSLDQVDAISRMATPDTEETVIDDALGLSNSALDRSVRHSRPPSREAERSVWERRRLVRQWNLDESELRFWGNLPAVGGQLFDDAIHQAACRIPVNPDTGLFDSYQTRSADALVELAATSNRSGMPPQMSVNVDYDVLTAETAGVAELAGGALVANQTARRLGCDAVVEAVVRQNNTVVGVGRNSRTVPGWLRRLVHHRDGGQCQFPGCHNRRWLQTHHIHHWADGGATELDNLILVCGFHHRFIHEHRWHITINRDDGRVVFRKPDWTIHPKPRPKLHPQMMQLVRPT